MKEITVNILEYRSRPSDAKPSSVLIDPEPIMVLTLTLEGAFPSSGIKEIPLINAHKYRVIGHSFKRPLREVRGFAVELTPTSVIVEATGENLEGQGFYLTLAFSATEIVE